MKINQWKTAVETANRDKNRNLVLSGMNSQKKLAGSRKNTTEMHCIKNFPRM